MGIYKMASIKKLIQSSVAALTLAIAGGGAAHAQQSYSDARIMEADFNVARANYNAALASCNSRAFGRSSNSWARAVAGGVEARACRVDAEADYYDRTAQIERRYRMPNQQTLTQAYNTRMNAVELQYDAAVAKCNARFADNLGRRGDWQKFGRDSANAQRCQANAEAAKYLNKANAERRYRSR